MEERCFNHYPLLWVQALLYDGQLGSFGEMAIGVNVKNEGIQVMMLESFLVLVDLLFVESFSCLTYVNFFAATTKYAVHLAVKSAVVGPLSPYISNLLACLKW